MHATGFSPCGDLLVTDDASVLQAGLSNFYLIKSNKSSLTSTSMSFFVAELSRQPWGFSPYSSGVLQQQFRIEVKLLKNKQK